jgi:hypothetical protein
MAIKDVLVHVDGSNAAPARLAAAIDLAQLHGAHLIGPAWRWSRGCRRRSWA